VVRPENNIVLKFISGDFVAHATGFFTLHPVYEKKSDLNIFF
jgi:hypothetical protein